MQEHCVGFSNTEIIHPPYVSKSVSQTLEVYICIYINALGVNVTVNWVPVSVTHLDQILDSNSPNHCTDSPHSTIIHTHQSSNKMRISPEPISPLPNPNTTTNLDIVQATLSYYTPPIDGSKPYTYINNDPITKKMEQNWVYDVVNLGIENVRGKEGEFAFNSIQFDSIRFDSSWQWQWFCYPRRIQYQQNRFPIPHCTNVHDRSRIRYRWGCREGILPRVRGVD